MSRRSLLAVASPLLLLIAGCSQSTPAPNAPVAPATPPTKSPAASTPAATEAPTGVAPTESAAPRQTEPAAGAPAKAEQAKGDPTAPAKTEPAPGSVADLMSRARKAQLEGKTDEAISLLEQVIEQDPKQRVALATLMQVTQRRGIDLAQAGNEKDAYPLFLKSATFMRQLIETPGGLGPQERSARPIVLYNESCAFARTGEPDKAIKSLEESLQAGFNDLAQIDKDSDMDPLRNREDFKKLRDGLEARKKGDGGTNKP